jgi:uncharacterized Zn finger protein
MGWGYWETYQSTPRRPANGIKARTQRGKFGATWWASRWIAALEKLVDPNRLSRGRSYARSGQVVKLEIGRGGVAARVQGSRPTPYKVAITIRPLSDEQWAKVCDAMAAEAIYAARLLSGEMPEQIEEVFHAAGASLLPATLGDLTTDCSCPDWANPCKHVAAVQYLVGEQFDVDPFLMFELRGRSKDDIASALRARRVDSLAEPAAPLATESTPELTEADDEDESLADFWTVPAAISDLAMSFERPVVDALPVKRLGPPNFARDQRDFVAHMERTYRAISDHARRHALGD